MKKAKPKKSGRPWFTPKQEKFIASYLVSSNATQAAKDAGYKGSYRTLESVGRENLGKPRISEELAKRTEPHAKKMRMSAADVILELARIGSSNISDYVDFGSGKGLRIKDLSEMTEDAKRCIKEVTMTKTSSGGTLKFRLYDKTRALELLGKRFGIFAIDRAAAAAAEALKNRNTKEVTAEEAKERLRIAQQALEMVMPQAVPDPSPVGDEKSDSEDSAMN